MKAFSLSFSLLTILITTTFMIHNAKGQDNSTLIDTTCKRSSKTDPNINYTFCTTSLQAAPASGCATLQGLGSISIRLVRYNITDTRCHIRHVIRSKKWDSYTRQLLDDCFELYSDAIPTVKEAMKDYNRRRFDDANIKLSAVMDSASTCEDGFKERRGGVASPLTKRNGDAFQLSAVALSIMNMIQTRSD